MVSRVSDFIPGVLLHQDHSTILAYVVKVVMALIALEQQSLHYFLCYYMSSTYYVQLLWPLHHKSVSSWRFQIDNSFRIESCETLVSWPSHILPRKKKNNQFLRRLQLIHVIRPGKKNKMFFLRNLVNLSIQTHSHAPDAPHAPGATAGVPSSLQFCRFGLPGPAEATPRGRLWHAVYAHGSSTSKGSAWERLGYVWTSQVIESCHLISLVYLFWLSAGL